MTRQQQLISERVLWPILVIVIAVSVGFIVFPQAIGIAAAVGGVVSIIMALDAPKTKSQKAAFIFAAVILFVAEMRAIRISSKEALDQTRELQDLAKKSLDSMTGGDSFPVVIVTGFRGNQAHLSLDVEGKNGLILSLLYITEEFRGRSRVLHSYPPGFILADDNPVVAHVEPGTPFDRHEKDWGYFSLPGDGYVLKCAISAYNGSYIETIRFSRKNGKWSAEWEATKHQDRSRTIRGQYPASATAVVTDKKGMERTAPR